MRAHAAWCEPAECFLGHPDDPGTDRSQHYSTWAGLQVDLSDCMPWRCEPEGTPEIIVRSALMDGHPAVEIQTDPAGNVQNTSGAVGVSWLTPAEARALADLILRSADAAEAAK